MPVARNKEMKWKVEEHTKEAFVSCIWVLGLVGYKGQRIKTHPQQKKRDEKSPRDTVECRSKEDC